MTDYAARRTMMVDTQIRPSDVTKFPIINAMLSTAREAFLPDHLKEAAYMGENVELVGGRVVLEPRTLAKMLDALDIQNDELVLDIGSGLGYSAAVIAHMAQAVVAVEEDSDMRGRGAGASGRSRVPTMSSCTRGPDRARRTWAVRRDRHSGRRGASARGADRSVEGRRADCLSVHGRRSLGVVRIGYKIDGHVNWRFAFNAGAPVLAGFERHTAFTL